MSEHLIVTLDAESVERVAQRVTEMLREGGRQEGMTVATFSWEFVERQRRDGAGQKALMESRWARRHLLEPLGHLRLQDLTAEDVIAVRDELVRQRLAGSTIDRLLRWLARLLQDAVETGHVQGSIMARRDLFVRPKLPRDHYFAPEAQQALAERQRERVAARAAAYWEGEDA